MLQAIPEIGPKKSELLLDAFGSPAGVANVAVGALEAVDGIGPKAAREIYRVFNGGSKNQ